MSVESYSCSQLGGPASIPSSLPPLPAAKEQKRSLLIAAVTTIAVGVLLMGGGVATCALTRNIPWTSTLGGLGLFATGVGITIIVSNVVKRYLPSPLRSPSMALNGVHVSDQIFSKTEGKCFYTLNNPNNLDGIHFFDLLKMNKPTTHIVILSDGNWYNLDPQSQDYVFLNSIFTNVSQGPIRNKQGQEFKDIQKDKSIFDKILVSEPVKYLELGRENPNSNPQFEPLDLYNRQDYGLNDIDGDGVNVESDVQLYLFSERDKKRNYYWFLSDQLQLIKQDKNQFGNEVSDPVEFKKRHLEKPKLRTCVYTPPSINTATG